MVTVLQLWDAGYPARIKHHHDMKTFSWKNTQFSQFNESDTLLLVSGVYFGSHSNTGEIAVFNIVVTVGRMMIDYLAPVELCVARSFNAAISIFFFFFCCVQDGFVIQCRVSNKPYDFFGTWYNDSYLLSGNLKWLGHLVSTSIVWLNRASQETDSEFTSVMNQMFKFYNRSASSIRSITVANCLSAPSPFSPLTPSPLEDSSAVGQPMADKVST